MQAEHGHQEERGLDQLPDKRKRRHPNWQLRICFLALPCLSSQPCLTHNRNGTELYSLVLTELVPPCVGHSEFAHQNPQNAQKKDEVRLKSWHLFRKNSLAKKRLSVVSVLHLYKVPDVSQKVLKIQKYFLHICYSRKREIGWNSANSIRIRIMLPLALLVWSFQLGYGHKYKRHRTTWRRLQNL